MKTLTTTAEVEAPEPRYRKREDRSIFGVGIEVAERVERVPAQPTERHPEHGPFWPVFLLDGEPLHPAAAQALIRDGAARLEDPERAFADLRIARVRTEMPHREFAQYVEVLSEHYRRDRAERVERLVALIDWTDGDDPLPWVAPPLLTKAEVARVLRVSERTVDRIAGQSIPAPIRVGGQVRFNGLALLQMIDR